MQENLNSPNSVLSITISYILCALALLSSSPFLIIAWLGLTSNGLTTAASRGGQGGGRVSPYLQAIFLSKKLFLSLENFFYLLLIPFSTSVMKFRLTRSLLMWSTTAERRSHGEADFRVSSRGLEPTPRELVDKEEEFWMAGLLLLYGQNITTTSFPLPLSHL